MTKKVIIPYFPRGMKLLSPLFFGVGVYLSVISHPLWGAILVMFGVLILTTNYVTEIDLGKKMYRDYLWMLGLRMNEDYQKFASLDRIVITKGSYSQAINTRVQSRQMDWSDYTGTLLLDNDSLDLLTKADKKELIKGIKEFSDFLQVDVEDRTMGEAYWIDMTKV